MKKLPSVFFRFIMKHQKHRKQNQKKKEQNYDIDGRIGTDHRIILFKNKKLLKQALTHSSYANEKKLGKLGCNERLEFLGDAVLELVSSDFLYARFPQIPEGELTKKRASLVCEPSLAYCARQFGLPKFLLLGRGENMTGGQKQRFYRIRCDRGTAWRDLP